MTRVRATEYYLAFHVLVVSVTTAYRYLVYRYLWLLLVPLLLIPPHSHSLPGTYTLGAYFIGSFLPTIEERRPD